MEEKFMAEALALAREAAEAGEVPVGCVIVREGVVVGRGRNRREEKQSTLSHAEMEAIAQANEHLGWRTAPCMSPWSPVPCAPGRSSTPASPGCTTGLGTGPWGPAAGC